MLESRLFRFALIGLLVLVAGSSASLAALESQATVVYDQYRVPTIQAKTEYDAIYMQGYLHAQDRFFQMDVQRRLFSGTLSELVGLDGLPQDVQLRTLGLRRAAEASLAVQSPEIINWLQAYADGVNGWLDGKVYGNLDDDDSCSSGGASSDESMDGHSDGSSDDDDSNSDDSSGGHGLLPNPLPPEYAALEIDRDGIPNWTPVDSLTMVKGLAFGLSFDLGDIDRTLAVLTFRAVLGDAPGVKLFDTDLYRSKPFDTTVSIPTQLNSTPVDELMIQAQGQNTGDDAIDFAANAGSSGHEPLNPMPPYMSDPNFEAMVRDYRDDLMESPLLQQALEGDPAEQGSNWWLASGAKTASGFPMIANDPHLTLGTPSTFYEVHLQVAGGMNVAGSSFPGAPGVVLGCTDAACWGATVNRLDVTDVFQEVLLALGPDPFQPTHSFFEGAPVPLTFIPQTYLFNIIGTGTMNTLVDALVPPEQGGVTIIVSHRNAPIVNISVDPSSPTPITGLSVQYTGWYPTRELEAFREFTFAATPQEFADGLQFFDVGSQNFAYADVSGNIAYFTSAEIPLRQDLQTLFFPDGLITPYLIRDGTNTNKHKWLPLTNPQPGQSTPYEILPFAEMPQVVNPPEGIIFNANNDPIGTTLDNVPWNEFRAGFNGRLYLAPGYAPGFRQGQIKKQLETALASGPLSLETFKAIQADNHLLDAEFFIPALIAAWDHASTSGAPEVAGLVADSRVAEAIGRLGGWDFSTPTGLALGFDPFDGLMGPPSPAEIDASVSSTIYAAWRGQLIKRVIDVTLGAIPFPLDGFAPGGSLAITAVQRFIDQYPTAAGTGASLINFFTVPGVSDNDLRYDLVMLGTLQSALDLLASDDFAPAFGNSSVQDEYRWGKLHRIVFSSVLGGPFDVPPAGGPGNLAPDLPGFARAGGLGSVDAAAHDARADGLNEFMFGSGPSRRLISTMTPQGPVMLEVLPGGESGVLGSPYQTDQLDLWLVNDYKQLPVSTQQVDAHALFCKTFSPPPTGGTQVRRPGIDRVAPGTPGAPGPAGRRGVEQSNRAGANSLQRR